MTYKEALFFTAKCLTISFEKENKKSVLSKLKSKEINWDIIVKVSTSHYVLPSLYCNLKRANLLKFIPKDLINYMDYITTINRERNHEIIKQVKKINTILTENKIKPIFIKGVGNLMANLYNDIAERMVGDIDFIVSNKNLQKTISILRNNGYYNVGKNKISLPSERHYRRLKKDKNIAAVEVHYNLISRKYVNEFSFDFIKKDTQNIDGLWVLSYANKINLSISSFQINDRGSMYKTIALKNAYDVFLLSKKTSAQKSISNFDSLKNQLNNFLAISYVTFGKVNSLKYTKTKQTEKYLFIYSLLLSNEKIRKTRIKLKNLQFFIHLRLSILFKSLIYNNYKNWMLENILNKAKTWKNNLFR